MLTLTWSDTYWALKFSTIALDACSISFWAIPNRLWLLFTAWNKKKSWVKNCSEMRLRLEHLPYQRCNMTMWGLVFIVIIFPFFIYVLFKYLRKLCNDNRTWFLNVDLLKMLASQFLKDLFNSLNLLSKLWISSILFFLECLLFQKRKDLWFTFWRLCFSFWIFY